MRYSSGMRSRSTAASRSSSNLARCSSSWAASSLSAYLHKWTGFQEQPCPGTICFRLLYKTDNALLAVDRQWGRQSLQSILIPKIDCG